MSERIADRRKLMDEAEGTMSVLQFKHPLPESDEDEDYIDTGAAILNFYCTLVDLLGRCAPDASVIAQVTSGRFLTDYKKRASQQADLKFQVLLMLFKLCSVVG